MRSIVVNSGVDFLCSGTDRNTGDIDDVRSAEVSGKDDGIIRFVG